MSSVDVAIGVVDGKVVAHWHEPVREITFDPQNAYQVGVALGKAAMEAHRGTSGLGDADFLADAIGGSKVHISDARRAMLVMQAATILKTAHEQGKAIGWMASQIVDVVLADTAK